MRLTRLKRHIRAPAEQERRRISVGKVVYLLLLVLLGVTVLRYGARKALNVEGQGFIRGESAAIQALHKGRVEVLRFKLLERVSAGEIVAVLGGDGAATPSTTIGDDRQRELEAERRRLLGRLQDERDQDVGRRAKERASTARELDRIRDRKAVLEARVAKEQALRAVEEEQRERWSRLFQLEAITLDEYLRRAPAERPVESDATIELAVLRAEEKRVLREMEVLSQQSQTPGGNRETLARLAWVREELNRSPSPRAAQQAVATGDVLRAPIDGVLATLRKKPGEVLLPGESLGELVDPESIFVEAYFHPQAESLLTPGTAVRLEFASGPKGEGQIASVDRIATPIADEYQKNYEPLQTGVRVLIRPLAPSEYQFALDTKVRVFLDRF